MSEPTAWKETPGVIFMQFTGLRDKNGKEIYEGDIVRWVYDPLYEPGLQRLPFAYVVEWQPDTARHAYVRKGIRPDFTDEIASHYEVIGNIHENSELVSGGASVSNL